MRPIRLELENFGVYRGRHSIDLSPLNFFVIKGRTGAGKSTLIDAICYALYGTVPRYGDEKAHKHLISRGQKSMYVSLEFSVRDKIYRIERYYRLEKKKGISEFRFYEDGKPKGFREEEIKKYLRDLLRLDYKTFTKVILLPQNQFDRFLKPESPKERREILNSLLGFSGVFSALKEFIRDEYKNLQNSILTIQQRLSQLSHANPQKLDTLEKELQRLQKEYEELSQRQKELREVLAMCKERDNVSEELTSVEKAIENFKGMESEIEGKKRRLELALELLTYIPKVEQYEQIERKERESLSEKKNIELELKKYLEERTVVEEEFKKVEEEYNKLGEYDEKKLELNNVLKHIEEYWQTLKEKDHIAQQVERTRKDILEELKREEECKQRLAKGMELTKEVQEKIRAYEDSGIEERIREVERKKEQLKRLKSLREEKGKKEVELARITEELNKLEKDLGVLSKKVEENRRKTEETEKSIEELKVVLSQEGSLLQENERLKVLLSKAKEREELVERRIKLENQKENLLNSLKRIEEEIEKERTRGFEIYALEIRASLKRGDTCPVCGGKIEEEHHAEIEEDLQSVLQRQKQLQKEREELKERITMLETQILSIIERENKLKEELGDASLDQLEMKLKEILHGLEHIERSRELYQQREKELANQRKEYEKLLKELENLRIKHAETAQKQLSTKHNLENLEEEERNLLNLLGGDERKVLEEINLVEEAYRDLKELREKERKYTQRLQEIQKELSEIEKRIAQLEQKEKSLHSQMADLQVKIDSLRKSIAQEVGEEPTKALEIRLREELTQLSQKIENIRENYKRIREYLERIRNEEAGLLSRMQSIEKLLDDLQSQKNSMAVELYELIKRFGSFEEVRKHTLTEQEIEGLRKEIENFEREYHSLQKRHQEVKEKLSKLANLPKTGEISRSLEEVEKSIHQNRELYGSLQKDIEQLKKDLKERQELEQRLGKLEAEFFLYGRLREDLTDDQFPEYVSQLMLSRIVERGSYYLFKFTGGQFVFDVVDGDLHVLDHSTGHDRIVSSLSGGETFLASLSLAFAVADILSQNAPLESLFIDEGFGSLDRETRESLSEFFDLIKQSTDRMVGIITHVEDIADKFSQRIEVEKKGGSATVKVIY